MLIGFHDPKIFTDKFLWQLFSQLKSHPENYEGYVPMAYNDYLKKLSKYGLSHKFSINMELSGLILMHLSVCYIYHCETGVVSGGTM